jgi:hypothetical protein
MMRLDVDSNPPVKIHSSNQTSLLSKLNDEINQLPNDIFSIECLSVSRTRKTSEHDEEYLNKNGFILRCKLHEKSNPIIPALRLYITTSYPEQSPEILSLTKTMPPRLEFTGRISGGENSNVDFFNRNIFRWTSIFRSNFIEICFAII